LRGEGNVIENVAEARTQPGELSSSQLGTQDFSNFPLRRPEGFDATIDELALARFGFDECFAGSAELWIAFPVSAQPLNTRIQVVLFWSAVKEKTPDRFIEQLIHRAPFDPAQVFKGGAFFGVNSQRECNSGHSSTLLPANR
jgi:hypothetical protein